MKKLISILLAAIMLAGALTFTASAEKKTPSASEYEKLREAAEFTASYYWGRVGYSIENELAWEISNLYPETAYYNEHDQTWVEYVTAEETMVAEAFRAIWSGAPVNITAVFLEEVRNGHYSAEYNSETDRYRINNYGKGGDVIIDPEIVGFIANDEGTYEFYLAKREKVYLPDEAKPDGWSDTFEYDGRVYKLGPGYYYTLGDFESTGFKLVLEMTEEGIMLVTYSENVAMPEQFDTPPAKPLTAFDYNRLRETADFLGSFYGGWEGFAFRTQMYLALEELYPDAVTYRTNEYGTFPESVKVSEEEFKTAFYTRYSLAPVNLFDLEIKDRYAGVLDSETGLYTVSYVGGYGGVVIIEPEIVGFIANEGGEYEFYLAWRERLDLPSEAYPPEGEHPAEIEYDGRVYHSSPNGYYALGDLESTGLKLVLEITEDGIVLVSHEGNYPIPEQFTSVPKPDGDFNGDGKINAKDVIAIMKALVKSGASVFVADINGDGKVNAKDVVALMKQLVAK